MVIIADDLLIPVAKTENGTYTIPEKAKPGGSYFCPLCGEPLLLRRGTKRRVHFAHKIDTDCTPEAIAHKAAKDMIVLAALSQRAINVFVACSRCGVDCGIFYPPGSFSVGVQEYPIGNRRIDVGLFRRRDKNLAMAVEILNTHAVDEQKRRDLDGVLWVELLALSVIANPHAWYPIQSSISAVCHACLGKAYRSSPFFNEGEILAADLIGAVD